MLVVVPIAEHDPRVLSIGPFRSSFEPPSLVSIGRHPAAPSPVVIRTGGDVDRQSRCLLSSGSATTGFHGLQAKANTGPPRCRQVACSIGVRVSRLSVSGSMCRCGISRASAVLRIAMRLVGSVVQCQSGPPWLVCTVPRTMCRLTKVPRLNKR